MIYVMVMVCMAYYNVQYSQCHIINNMETVIFTSWVGKRLRPQCNQREGKEELYESYIHTYSISSSHAQSF